LEENPDKLVNMYKTEIRYNHGIENMGHKERVDMDLDRYLLEVV
jgi:hypothetical protein